jgi:hypothetical protein
MSYNMDGQAATWKPIMLLLMMIEKEREEEKRETTKKKKKKKKKKKQIDLQKHRDWPGRWFLAPSKPLIMSCIMF